MSEFKHTPGDWIASGHEVWATRPIRFNLTTAGTPLIATVAMHDDCEGGFPYEANVHLIAAAPDLISAHDKGLKVISMFAQMAADGSIDCRDSAMIELCGVIQEYSDARSAAIAKAQGGAA